jgi:hypothetical protein
VLQQLAAQDRAEQYGAERSQHQADQARGPMSL